MVRGERRIYTSPRVDASKRSKITDRQEKGIAMRLNPCMIAASMCLAASLAYAQPANDDCLNRQSVGIGSTAFDSTLATTDAYADCAGGGSDIYFEFNPATSGSYIIDLCGSSYDTVLTILNGCGGAQI